MPLSNPAEILLKHDHWATRQLLDACANLSTEQLHRPFEMGPGSVHATITHLVGAMRGWSDVLAGREIRPRLEQDGLQRTPAQLVPLLDDVAADVARWTLGRPADEMVSRERGGKVYSFTRGAVLAHLATHGAHHRAQCLNMLRHLGVKSLPKSSVMEWTLAES